MECFSFCFAQAEFESAILTRNPQRSRTQMWISNMLNWIFFNLFNGAASRALLWTCYLWQKCFIFCFVVICFCIARLWPGVIDLGRPVSCCHPKKRIYPFRDWRDVIGCFAKMHSRSPFIPIKHWNKLENPADSGVPHTARALYRPRYNGLVFFILLFFYIPSMYRGYLSPLLLLLLLLLL